LTISLGGVDLDDDLQLDGDLAPAGIVSGIKQTFGRVVVVTTPKTSGNELILSASGSGEKFYGAFTRSQVRLLADLRDAGAGVALVHPKYSGSVFMPADCLDGLTPYDGEQGVVDPPETEELIGSIRLIKL